MKKKIAVLTLCLSAVFGSLCAGAAKVQAAPAYNGSHYGMGLDAYDDAAMELSSWSNGVCSIADGIQEMCHFPMEICV